VVDRGEGDDVGYFAWQNPAMAEVTDPLTADRHPVTTRPSGSTATAKHRRSGGRPNGNRDGSSDARSEAIGAALPPRKQNSGLPAKNLLGLPWRVALALQADGWIIRNAIVWHKPNAMPESVADRLSTRYELLFLLVRQRRYYFDLDPIREPLARPEALAERIVIGGSNKGRHGGVDATRRRRGASVYGAGKYADVTTFAGNPPGEETRPTGRAHTHAHPHGRNPGDVWTISTRPLREAHFAAFPVDLPLRCIAAGCPLGGTVLDPFSGAATTGLAARRLGRPYIGIDLNPTFHDIGIQRLSRQAQHPTDHVDNQHRSDHAVVREAAS
jgi:site-specific DNA-methyltransferase (cytosine-N4-specific)